MTPSDSGNHLQCALDLVADEVDSGAPYRSAERILRELHRALAGQRDEECRAAVIAALGLQPRPVAYITGGFRDDDDRFLFALPS